MPVVKVKWITFVCAQKLKKFPNLWMIGPCYEERLIITFRLIFSEMFVGFLIDLPAENRKKVTYKLIFSRART